MEKFLVAHGDKWAVIARRNEGWSACDPGHVWVEFHNTPRTAIVFSTWYRLREDAIYSCGPGYVEGAAVHLDGYEMVQLRRGK